MPICWEKLKKKSRFPAPPRKRRRNKRGGYEGKRYYGLARNTTRGGGVNTIARRFQNFEEMVWLSDKKALFHVF